MGDCWQYLGLVSADELAPVLTAWRRATPLLHLDVSLRGALPLPDGTVVRAHGVGVAQLLKQLPQEIISLLHRFHGRILLGDICRDLADALVYLKA